MSHMESTDEPKRKVTVVTELLFRFVERSLAAAAVIIAGLALGTQPSVRGGFMESFEIRVGALTALFGIALYAFNFIATVEETKKLGVRKFTLVIVFILLLMVTSTLVSVTYRIQQGQIKFPLPVKSQQAK